MPDGHHTRAARIAALAKSLENLSQSQLDWIESVVRQFSVEPVISRNPSSDLVTDCVLLMFGDALQIHHCLSNEALSKDKFEYALERVLNRCGISAKLIDNKCNPGHDITISGVPFSLKTQADKGLKAGFIHISKFMELGKGDWGDRPEQLIGLRDRFLHHMESYERILQLRRLVNEKTVQEYELVEIPKDLLLRAQDGEVKMMLASTQSPKPGTCTVADASGAFAFELYFDGGTERKLQVRHLRKNLCVVHAVWRIMRIPPRTEEELN